MTKQADQSLKECPMCTELISVRAKKCKHCGEYFESPSKETVKKETVKKETVNRTEQTGTNEIEVTDKIENSEKKYSLEDAEKIINKNQEEAENNEFFVKLLISIGLAIAGIFFFPLWVLIPFIWKL